LNTWTRAGGDWLPVRRRTDLGAGAGI